MGGDGCRRKCVKTRPRFFSEWCAHLVTTFFVARAQSRKMFFEQRGLWSHRAYMGCFLAARSGSPGRGCSEVFEKSAWSNEWVRASGPKTLFFLQQIVKAELFPYHLCMNIGRFTPRPRSPVKPYQDLHNRPERSVGNCKSICPQFLACEGVKRRCLLK